MTRRRHIAALAGLGVLCAVPAAARLVPHRLPPAWSCAAPVEIVRGDEVALACDRGAAALGPVLSPVEGPVLSPVEGERTCDDGGAPRVGDRITIAGDRCALAPMSAWKRLALGLLVDVNRASAADLAVLPGLGPTLAERIVAERAAHGAFESLADLARVEGMGAGAVENLTPVAFAGHSESGR